MGYVTEPETLYRFNNSRPWPHWDFMLPWAQHAIESHCHKHDRGLCSMHRNRLIGHAGPRGNIWSFTKRYGSTSLLTISYPGLMANPQSTDDSTSAIDYEELLEEMKKLDIADLLLIHRRVTMRWIQPLKNIEFKRQKREIVLESQ